MKSVAATVGYSVLSLELGQAGLDSEDLVFFFFCGF